MVQVVAASMSIFLGIDGGGTKTTCVVGDEVSVLGSATAGGSNIVRVGEAAARSNLHQAIREACTAAGVAASAVEGVCIGVAGSSVPEVSATIQGFVRELLSANSRVVGDMVIAMEDALSDLPGAIVIAGTGSIAFGRNQRGETARAGGWGWAISDEGSGQWIGRTAVTEVMRAHDSGQPTSLADHILGAWKITGLPDLVRQANATPPPDFSQLFLAVVSAASAGDVLAREVLARAGHELARLCELVIKRLWSPRQQVRVALGGGVFAHAPLVRLAFFAALRKTTPNACLSFRITDPAAGALKLARKAAIRSENAESALRR